jgi:hypothetical protein
MIIVFCRIPAEERSGSAGTLKRWYGGEERSDEQPLPRTPGWQFFFNYEIEDVASLGTRMITKLFRSADLSQFPYGF